MHLGSLTISRSRSCDNVTVSLRPDLTVLVGENNGGKSNVVDAIRLLTFGVPVEEIVQGIKHGVRKVNIDTDLRMSSTGAVRKFLAENKKEFDPRKWLAASTKGMKEICKARYEAFGCAGQASKIKVLSLEEMTKRYDKGELNPRVN